MIYEDTSNVMRYVGPPIYLLVRKWCFLSEERFWSEPVEFMVGPLPPADAAQILTESFGHGHERPRIRITGTLLNAATGTHLCDKFELRACELRVGADAELYVATECWPVHPWVHEVTNEREDFPVTH